MQPTLAFQTVRSTTRSQRKQKRGSRPLSMIDGVVRKIESARMLPTDSRNRQSVGHRLRSSIFNSAVRRWEWIPGESLARGSVGLLDGVLWCSAARESNRPESSVVPRNRSRHGSRRSSRSEPFGSCLRGTVACPMRFMIAVAAVPRKTNSSPLPTRGSGPMQQVALRKGLLHDRKPTRWGAFLVAIPLEAFVSYQAGRQRGGWSSNRARTCKVQDEMLERACSP